MVPPNCVLILTMVSIVTVDVIHPLNKKFQKAVLIVIVSCVNVHVVRSWLLIYHFLRPFRQVTAEVAFPRLRGHNSGTQIVPPDCLHRLGMRYFNGGPNGLQREGFLRAALKHSSTRRLRGRSRH